MKKTEETRLREALRNWTELNRYLMKCKDDDALTKLEDLEVVGRKRRQFLLRITSRRARLVSLKVKAKYAKSALKSSSRPEAA